MLLRALALLSSAALSPRRPHGPASRVLPCDRAPPRSRPQPSPDCAHSLARQRRWALNTFASTRGHPFPARPYPRPGALTPLRVALGSVSQERNTTTAPGHPGRADRRGIGASTCCPRGSGAGPVYLLSRLNQSRHRSCGCACTHYQLPPLTTSKVLMLTFSCDGSACTALGSGGVGCWHRSSSHQGFWAASADQCACALPVGVDGGRG